MNIFLDPTYFITLSETLTDNLLKVSQMEVSQQWPSTLPVVLTKGI